jgi:hypothetical protein
MFCAARWWLEAGQPVARVELSRFLDAALKRCGREGIKYPKILLLRLRQLQRGEWQPREELARILHPDVSSGSGLFCGSPSGQGGFQTVREFLSGGDPEDELREIENSIECMEAKGERDDFDMGILRAGQTRLQAEVAEPRDGRLLTPDRELRSQKPSPKPVFELATPGQRLTAFGQIVLHYVNEGYESLEQIEAEAVKWCQEYQFPLPDNPCSEVRRILRRVVG